MTSWSRANGIRVEPGEALQLVLAQPWPGHPDPDQQQRDDEALEQRPRPAREVVERAPPPPQIERRRTAATSRRSRHTRRAGRARTEVRCIRCRDRRRSRCRRWACRRADVATPRPPRRGTPGRRAVATSATTAPTPRRCRRGSAYPAASVTDADGQGHRQFIGEQLRRRAHRPDQGVLVGARPPRHQRPENADAGRRQHEQRPTGRSATAKPGWIGIAASATR
jgi:hypothetical protein